MEQEKIICAAVWYKELELKGNLPFECYLPINIDEAIECLRLKCNE